MADSRRSPRSPRRSGLAGIAASVAVTAACAGAASSGQAPVVVQQPPARFGYRVVNVYPHDANAFTQGLLFQGGVLYESTGQNGQSSLRRVDLTTGKVLAKRDLAEQYFGEGLAAWQDQLIQLTWRAGRGFVYDRDTFAPMREFSYTGEGWGLASDGRRLILSDGSSRLRFLDPATFAETGTLGVRDTGVPVRDLNELEVMNGEILANVWHTDRIARIDPASGAVTGWIDLAGLLKPGEVTNGEAVLNGIAWDAEGGRLFVTGKLWPKLFEIAIEPR
ncbi:MAG: glutaminyl-peptide cyclotransferase [Vicinamibacterales bacterium]